LCIGITIVTFVQILWMLFKLVFKILDWFTYKTYILHQGPILQT
jgi:hypothetical protein